MSFLPLVLSVKCLNWRMDDSDSELHDAEFQRVRKKALERDKNSCRFCGFTSLSYQEVHHLNDDHSDNRLDNLVTACSFCHMVQHIGLAGKNKEASLVWLPEISQGDLNHLVRALLVAQHPGAYASAPPRRAARAMPTGPSPEQQRISEVARATMSALRDREYEAERRFLTSDPAVLGNALKLLPDEFYERRAETLSGLRLLPLGRRTNADKDVMAEMLNVWTDRGGPFSGLKPTTWEGLFKSKLGML